MSQCTKCGTRSIGTAANPPKDGLCRYCEMDALRTELAAARNDAALWKKSEAEASAAYDACKAELNAAKRREAALRQALESICKEARACLEREECEMGCEEILEIAKPALQHDAGRDFVPREQVLPLASCLSHIKTTALECREDPAIVLAAVGLSACGGVTHAKTLGF
jgi:hypothetical protein